MSGPEMEPPTQSLADANDAEAAHDDRAGEWMREQSAAWNNAFADMVQEGYGNGPPPPPRASAVPARVAAVLAVNDLTMADAQRMDDDELMGIPQIGPASYEYIRSMDLGGEHNRSAWFRYIARIQNAINTRWGSGR